MPEVLKGVSLSSNDILNAAILAFFITWLITRASKIFKSAITLPTELNYEKKDLSRIIQKCYHLFPKDILQFQGVTFKRGMSVRVTTNQHKIFEGEFIGLNNDNMLCVLTNRYIVAHELDKIEEMSLIER